VRVLVLQGYDGDAKSEPKVRPGSRALPGYCGSSLSRDVYLALSGYCGSSLSRDVYLDSVIGDL
jgi:hypothetical protein